MAEAPADARAIVRLDQCPRCGYDLVTLPRRHICPECGLAYDERMFVVEGKPRGGTYWDHQAVAAVVLLVLWAGPLGALFLGRRLGGGPLLLLVVLGGAVVIFTVAAGLQRLRQRPGKALLIWVDAEGIATQPAFRWKKRQPWSRFRRPNAKAAPTLFSRGRPDRWRLRMRPKWPPLVHDPGLDVYVKCSKREIALVRNAMRRLRLAALAAGPGSRGFAAGPAPLKPPCRRNRSRRSR